MPVARRVRDRCGSMVGAAQHDCGHASHQAEETGQPTGSVAWQTIGMLEYECSLQACSVGRGTPVTSPRRDLALVVDDDARSRELLQQLLKLDGYEVHAVAGGQAALALLADVVPDVAVIDLRMPGMDGLELCRKIRGLARAGRDLPSLVLTGMDDDAARQAAIDAGADLSSPNRSCGPNCMSTCACAREGDRRAAGRGDRP